MLPVLQNVEAISSSRDRDALGRLVLRAAVALLGEHCDVAIFRREPRCEAVLTLSVGPTVMASALGPWAEMVEKTQFSGQRAIEEIQGRTYGVFALQSSEVGSNQALLAFCIDSANSEEPISGLSCLAAIYGNQMRLLDYSELDTLTRLFNRKTFDETFDRLLTASASGDLDEDQEDRRDQTAVDGAPWLGVIDIDHFKRINDNFGHLFGDEVLLRVGELMRKTFRSSDRLFRFGGEEFVVILNAQTEEIASRGFNRFREAVEAYEFPQVGRVTCSVGITNVADTDVPTDVIGRADEALYYAKEHGRNQVHCYESLLAQGLISGPAVPEEKETEYFDIDALFA